MILLKLRGRLGEERIGYLSICKLGYNLLEHPVLEDSNRLVEAKVKEHGRSDELLLVCRLPSKSLERARERLVNLSKDCGDLGLALIPLQQLAEDGDVF